MTEKKLDAELEKRFPWLRWLTPVAVEMVDKLVDKERHYAGSWAKRGGVGAYMMTARKSDRIEEIVKRYGYDVFAALEENDSDILDDLQDLASYLLLILAMHEEMLLAKNKQESHK